MRLNRPESPLFDGILAVGNQVMDLYLDEWLMAIETQAISSINFTRYTSPVGAVYRTH